MKKTKESWEPGKQTNRFGGEMSTYWTSTLSVIDQQGNLIFRVICNRHVERRPGLTTASRTLHKLFRRHLPEFKQCTTSKSGDSHIRLAGLLNNGQEVILLYDPSLKAQTGEYISMWKRFFDKLEYSEEKDDDIPLRGSARESLLKHGLTIKENPAAPVYYLGVTLPTT